jgi:CubicO group peptidase (beta-lactamase class C family)
VRGAWSIACGTARSAEGGPRDTVLIIVAVILVLLGLGAIVMAKRRTEQRTFTFAAPVRRVELRASQRPWHLGGEISYRVEVAAGVDIRASTGAGAVGVEGTSGEVDLTTGVGMVRFANLSGRVRATTNAGKVLGPT